MAWTTPKTWVDQTLVTADDLNEQVRDNLESIGGSWTSFTPSWTNITVGNGSMLGAYIATGGLHIVRVQFTLGSTSSFGSDPKMTLPNASALVSAQAETGVPLGMVHALDSGTGIFSGYVQADTSTTIRVRFVVASGTYASATGTPQSSIPMTWTTNDRLDLFFQYEAA